MKSEQNRFSRNRHFTLIEIVVVVVIIILLASLAAPQVLKHLRTAKRATAQAQIEMFDQALISYKIDVGSFPATEDGLQLLVENVNQNEKWDGPYLKPAVIPKDPWGNDYVYVCPGEHGDFDLVSYGADGVEGGEGENADVTNYQKSGSASGGSL